jgi:hypothetical protein
MFGPESGRVRRLAQRRTVHRGDASAVTRLECRLRDVEAAAAGAASELLRLLNHPRQAALDHADVEVLEDLADRMGEARAAAWRGSQDLARLRSRGG